MSGCIFCDILAARAPASLVYEDDLAIVILDLFPVSDGHALVIARQHAEKVNQLAPGVAAHLMALAGRVMTAQAQLDPSIEAHNLLINDGKIANQHVIPRRRGDGVQSLLNWSTRFLQRFNMTSRRRRLDRLAAALQEQLRAG